MAEPRKKWYGSTLPKLKAGPMHRRLGVVDLGSHSDPDGGSLFQGCGLKADSSPRQIKPLKPVADLKLQEGRPGGILRMARPGAAHPGNAIQDHEK